MKRPICVLVTGRPGAGKTTLASRLSERLFVPVVSRDDLKEGYVTTRGVRHDELPAETNGLVNDIFFETVRRLLDAGVSLIAEAAFQHRVWHRPVADWSTRADLVVVRCRIDDVEAERRHLERGVRRPERAYFHGDSGIDAYRRSGAIDPPAPFAWPVTDAATIDVATTGPYEPGLDELVETIRRVSGL